MLSQKTFKSERINMKNMKNTEILDYFFKIRNITNPRTQKLYKITLQEYSHHQQKNIHELLEEAEQEEETGIRWKHRTLKKRLIEYRVYLYNKHAINTAKHRFTRITTFYQQFDIEIHQLPKWITKHEEPVMNYRNLPDKEIIRAAINIASPVMKPIILFMSSSGCARTETLNLTINNYIEATQEYHQSNDIYEIINTLNNIEDVVPTWNILRQKTQKYYTTFCSPETVTSINHYLLSRTDTLTPQSKLFKINPDYFSVKFTEINKELNLGKVGTFNRFRSHMLRKFHASTLMNDGMSRETVNDLQGKSKNSVDEVYFYNNPKSLKEVYIQHLPAVTIMQDVEKVTVKSPEFHRLENELREKTDAVEAMSNRMDNMERMLQEIANQNVTWEDVKKEY